MNVLVTGGTGFVGEEVVRRLKEEGHGVRLLVRHGGSRRVKEIGLRYGGELQAGDVTERETLATGWQGIEAVIHLVGIISEVGKTTFERVHALGTQNMVEGAKRAGIRRFIHMSALGTRPNAVARYHQSKWAGEEAVRGNGLDFTIFRPSLIYGPKDKFVNLFAKMSRFSPVLPVMSRPGVKFQPVSVETVAKAFVGALTEPRSFGQTYDLCGPERFTLPELLNEILAVLGRKRWKLQVPPGLARCQAAMLEFIFPRLLGKAPPLNRDQLLMLQEDNVGDSGPATKMFGLRQRGFREGIGRFLKREA
jgi:NADH dehydrogenase